MEVKKKSIKALAIRSPFWMALVFFGVSSGLDIGIILAGLSGLLGENVGVIDVVMQSLLALGVLWWLGWLRIAGFNGPAQWSNLSLLWLPALLALIYLASAFVTPVSGPGTLAFAIIAALLTGLDEEARFRGVMLQSFLPLGQLAAAALSGFFFGVAHLNNLLTHAPSLIVLGQVIGAFLLGFGFAACRLRTHTIWPLILFHALYDLPADITLFHARNGAAVGTTLQMLSPLEIALALITPGLLLACYGLFLLRPQRTAKQPEMPQ